MTEKVYEKFVQRLIDDGWKKSTMSIKSEDFYYYKCYEEYENVFGDTQYRYQILILFYDWRKIGKEAALEVRGDDVISVSIIVMALDLKSGRADLEFNDFDSLTGIERIASEYYNWIRKNFKCRDR